jgi:hypothetical protein
MRIKRHSLVLYIVYLLGYGEGGMSHEN